MSSGIFQELTVRSGLILVLAVATGYTVHTLQDAGSSRLSVQQVPALEYFLTRQSFGEIENANATVDALAQRYLTEVHARSNPSVLKLGGLATEIKPRVAEGILELERGMEKFKGTDNQLVL